MTKRMLIDATHAEETRVVVLDGNRLDDFDVETAAKKQLKGNIYLAKVVRVEPSLQAAFVEYGGGRHGFLAFGEIHPDYYQIPVADRQRLLEMQEAEARAEEEAEDAAAAAAEAAGTEIEAELEAGAGFEDTEPAEPPLPFEEPVQLASQDAAVSQDFVAAREEALPAEETPGESVPEPVEALPDPVLDVSAPEAEPAETAEDAAPATPELIDGALPAEQRGGVEALPPAPPPEMLESAIADQAEDDEADEGAGTARREARPPRFMRSYKIQEVIRRRQILLVQVVKEERGTKGAALTTFISLAGRFSVLMPNSPRGGGISRKITSAADRRRLKEVTTELQIPRGMGMIIRTAGAARPKAEIKRDCEYLLELWDSIRDTTMASIAPALIHEEASLIKRAIRDNYSRDVEEVLVDGEAGWRAARDFMRMLMPAHARKVILWNEPQPLFARQNVEAHLDAMMQPNVQLRSGGYLVINQTEALVAIDVNSGRSTRERGIEETALKTNLEAADEVARQLRLRDLAGLIVIDFIDMESRRNNAAVEKRIKEALKDDRARIQIGAISHFGLMELSRQRLRPSLAETSFTTCPHCAGTGLIRTTETAALAVLRAVEEEGAKRRAAAILVHMAGSVALYVLNHKRARLAEIEQRYGMSVSFAADDTLMPPQTRIDRLRPQTNEDLPAPTSIPISPYTPEEDDLVVEEADTDDESEDEADAELAPANETAEEVEARSRKRRRRRRGGRREEGAPSPAAGEDDPALAEQPAIAASPGLDGDAEAGGQEPDVTAPVADAVAEPVAEATDATEAAGDDDGKARRRGRRGGRRRRREPEGEVAASEPDAEAPASFDHAPAYAGPTPADPFGQVYDIFDIMDEQERPAAPQPLPEPLLAAAPAERPVEEGEMAEATVPAQAAPGTLTEMIEVAVPPPSAEVAPPVEEPTPAIVEEEPPLLNGHAEPEPEPLAIPDAPVSAPVPAPILVTEEIPAAEKKRGWWRRT